MLQAFRDDHQSNLVLLGGINNERAVAQTDMRNPDLRLLKDCKN